MHLTVALISATYFDSAGPGRLLDDLSAARAKGAALAVLPEIPMDPWLPATREARDSDAEAPDGPRHQALAAAARSAGIGVLGGAIVRDAVTNRRHNTALLFDASGRLAMQYRKVHLPEEEGFWETSHYEPGDELSRVDATFGIRIGVQTCSDINRPEGAHLLGALGAEAIINPRATEPTYFARWKTVFVANAMTSGAYVLSVNRPRDESGVPLGGPSFAVAPTGEVLVETLDPIAIVTLDRAIVEQARAGYPGYLATRADLYAEGWKRARTTRLPHQL